MILYVSGATGGHIYPGIAMAQALNESAYFIVSRSYPAKDILKAYELSYQVIGFSIKSLILFPIIIGKIIMVFLTHRPKMMMAMGGGICIPFAVVAWCLRVPVISFEQNAIPGRATCAIQWFSKKIITAFESAKHGIVLKSKVCCLGNPMRLNYPTNDRLPSEWNKIKKTTLLVVGGSQGAEKINAFIHANRHQIMALGMNIVHLTGPRFLSEKDYISETVDEHTYVALPYLNNMTLAYEKASIVLCRSGATTLSEIHYQQIPSILVPYPFAMDDHQEINAIEFVKSHPNSCWVPESELSMVHIAEQMKTMNKKISHELVPDPVADMNMICELVKTYLK